MKEEPTNNNSVISKYKFLICVLTYMVITFIDLLRNDLSTQCTLIALLYFLINQIEKYQKNRKILYR